MVGLEKCLNGLIIKLIPPEAKLGSGVLEKADNSKPSQLGTVVIVADNWDNVETPVVGDKVLYALAAGQEARSFSEKDPTTLEKFDYLNLLPEEVIAIL